MQIASFKTSIAPVPQHVCFAKPRTNSARTRLRAYLSLSLMARSSARHTDSLIMKKISTEVGMNPCVSRIASAAPLYRHNKDGIRTSYQSTLERPCRSHRHADSLYSDYCQHISHLRSHHLQRICSGTSRQHRRHRQGSGVCQPWSLI